MSGNIQIVLIALLFLILVSIQYTLNKILVELKEIKRTNILNIKRNISASNSLYEEKMKEEN